MPGWGTPDWDHAGPWYRGMKAVFHYPVKWAMRVQGKGWEKFPRSGGVVVAPNHFSWADPVAQQVVIGRPAFFLAKHSLFRTRSVGWLLRATRMIPVDRQRGGNEAAVLAARDEVERGRVVAVYPEGTRSRWPELLPFKTGAVRIALLTGAPIVPVAILTDRFWPLGKLLPRFGRRVYVNVGEPYTLGKDEALAADREFCRKATEDLRRRVEALLAECAAARNRGEKWRFP